MSNQKTEMPFWDHLEELRWRLIKSIVFVLIGAFISYYYSDEIMDWLIVPTQNLSIDLNLQVLKVTSMFTIKLSIAIMGGMILGLPAIIYQFWKFISPAFEKKHDITLLFTLLFSSIFFLIGMLFGYNIIVPFSLGFFTSLTAGSLDIAYNFTLEGYLIYVMWLLFACGLVFQLPVISTFFTRIGLLTADGLKKNRKFAIVIFLILGAVLTPPDPLSQVMIFVPLLLLYEFSIFLSWATKRKSESK